MTSHNHSLPAPDDDVTKGLEEIASRETSMLVEQLVMFMAVGIGYCSRLSGEHVSIGRAGRQNFPTEENPGRRTMTARARVDRWTAGHAIILRRPGQAETAGVEGVMAKLEGRERSFL